MKNIRTRLSLPGGGLSRMIPGLAAALATALFAGCANMPIGTDKVSPAAVYNQVEKSALGSGELSASTTALLNRYDLQALAQADPVKALGFLHQKAVETGDRDLLFALAELSYCAGQWVRAESKPWACGIRQDRTPEKFGLRETRDARDYYLGASVYAYLFLFGEAKGEKPDAFDRRYRLACDLYNYGLGLALTEQDDTGAVVRYEGGVRRLPFGQIELRLDPSHFFPSLADVEEFLMADQFSVHGVSVRNRKAGLGAPLIAIGHQDPGLRLHRAVPSTVFLRLPDSLGEIAKGQASGVLELFSTFDSGTVVINGAQVPLEADFTASRAYVLNQSYAWKSGRMQFLSPLKALKSQLILSEPYRKGCVPLVLVHGTFSSPVWWSEMVNTLNADHVLRSRYQIWLFLYSSSQPILFSADELRGELTATVKRLDPEGKDPALQEMVVVGHSQGGLLAKLTATDTGSVLWQQFSKKTPEELNMTEAQRETIQRLAFCKPLPFVKSVIFIATPHRGSYQSGNFVRNLGRKLISLPQATIQTTSDILTGVQGIDIPDMFRGIMPSSLDGMSPKNPVMLALAEIPVAPGIDAHSIIAVEGNGDFRKGNDGVVAYSSAHVDYAQSEFIVRGFHSCQSMPPTIEEVRRILLDHLANLPAADTNAASTQAVSGQIKVQSTKDIP